MVLHAMVNSSRMGSIGENEHYMRRPAIRAGRCFYIFSAIFATRYLFVDANRSIV